MRAIRNGPGSGSRRADPARRPDGLRSRSSPGRPELRRLPFRKRVLHGLHQVLQPAALAKQGQEVRRLIVVTVELEHVAREASRVELAVEHVVCAAGPDDAGARLRIERFTVPWERVQEKGSGVFRRRLLSTIPDAIGLAGIRTPIAAVQEQPR